MIRTAFPTKRTQMAPPRQISLTPELVSLCFRKEESRGFGDQLTPLAEVELDAIAQRLLDECEGEPLWVFAFGSLIWKPSFEPVEAVRATALGWHRSFCIELIDWRGTPEQPGLMMALDRGGRCNGVAFRLLDDNRLAELKRMVRREIPFQEAVNMARWIKLQTAAGQLR